MGFIDTTKIPYLRVAITEQQPFLLGRSNVLLFEIFQASKPVCILSFPELFSATWSSWAWRTPFSMSLLHKLVSKCAPEAGVRRGTPLPFNLFITEEVLIKFMVLKTPTYQLLWRAGQAIVNMNHQSISHFNEMKQINCFLERCLSHLLSQVWSCCIKFTLKQLVLMGF